MPPHGQCRDGFHSSIGLIAREATDCRGSTVRFLFTKRYTLYPIRQEPVVTCKWTFSDQPLARHCDRLQLTYPGTMKYTLPERLRAHPFQPRRCRVDSKRRPVFNESPSCSIQSILRRPPCLHPHTWTIDSVYTVVSQSPCIPP